MDLRSAFKNVIGNISNNSVQKVTNSIGNNFLRYGNRNQIQGDWSGLEMSNEDMYRGYSFAVIQKRGNKVASLAKGNLRTWANPETVKAYQELDDTPFHPYLKLIEDSTRFSEKQFWKNISIYLDLAGRYYLGVVRQPMGDTDMLSDIKEFIMLNPYEIRRVVNSAGELAGYVENKSDGRYREWPVDMIIEMRELNPFDPENSQWSMVEAAKQAVFTLNESGNYTRQSLHGNIDAPGIITTDVILDDESFANFRERVREHRKGEPLFGNGAGAIKWESMQVDLDKAALLDINNMNREELFAVSGTSKTALGIEQSGVTRDTAKVQNENFISDTAQPRLEDIIDFLNLDYKKYYNEDYHKTGFSIIIESAVGRDYSAETTATSMRQAQADLALSLIQAKYTPTSAYQYAEGEIGLADLELQEGYELPNEPLGGDTADLGDSPDSPDTPDTPDEPVDPSTPEVEEVVEEVVENELDIPEDQGWIGATVEPIDVLGRLTNGLKSQLYQGDVTPESTNIPGQENPHFTVIYGLTAEGMDGDLDDLCMNYIPEAVEIDDIEVFESEDYNIIVATLDDLDDTSEARELDHMHEVFLSLDHYPQEFNEYKPHVTLCYINKNANPEDFINAFKDLENKNLMVTGYEIDNPFTEQKTTNHLRCSHAEKKIGDFINALEEDDGSMLKDAYDTLLGEIVSIEKEAIDLAVDNVTVNNFSIDDISTKKERETLLEKLKSAFKNYWWFVMPLFGRIDMSNRNEEYGGEYTFNFDDDLKKKIEEDTTEVSASHLNTIMNDILDAANKAYSDVVEDAAANIILTSYKDDPSKFADYFTKEPSKEEIKKTIENTDILEQNRKIYERANKLAEQGYNRSEIVKSIREEYSYISEVRANTIAGNETARAFTQSQFEADYQYLNATGQLKTAYKQMFSTTGHPCAYCQALIDQGPIPFTENFLNKGESIEVVENGKTHTFTADYEAISSGVVHCNCHCTYRLILSNVKNSSGRGWFADNENNPHVPAPLSFIDKQTGGFVDPTDRESFASATPEFLNSLETAIREGNKDFGNSIKNIKFTVEDTPTNYGGYVDGVIKFHPDMLSGGEAQKKHEASDQFMDPSAIGTQRHEIAHAGFNQLAKKKYGEGVSDAQEATLFKAALNEYNPTYAQRLKAGQLGSPYAKRYYTGTEDTKIDHNRYASEVFAEMYSGNGTRKYAQEIYNKAKQLSVNQVSKLSKQLAQSGVKNG